MPELQTQEGFFPAPDGTQLFFRSTRKGGSEPLGHAIVLHGFAEHMGRQSTTVNALVEAGWAAHAVDVRGHGQSGGARAFVERFDRYLGDLGALLDRVRAQAPGGKVFAVAHSHGALILLRYLLDHPDAVEGAVLSSPYLRLKMQVSPLKILAGRLVEKILPGLPMRNDLRAELLTRDAAIQEATRKDPNYLQVATPRWFVESTHAQSEVLARAGELRVPLLCQLGASDPVADPQGGRELFEKAGSRDKKLLVYEGLLHEIFHEPERAKVLGDSVTWLNQHVSAARPAASA